MWTADHDLGHVKPYSQSSSDSASRPKCDKMLYNMQSTWTNACETNRTTHFHIICQRWRYSLFSHAVTFRGISSLKSVALVVRHVSASHQSFERQKFIGAFVSLCTYVHKHSAFEPQYITTWGYCWRVSGDRLAKPPVSADVSLPFTDMTLTVKLRRVN